MHGNPKHKGKWRFKADPQKANVAHVGTFSLYDKHAASATYHSAMYFPKPKYVRALKGDKKDIDPNWTLGNQYGNRKPKGNGKDDNDANDNDAQGYFGHVDQVVPLNSILVTCGLGNHPKAAKYNDCKCVVFETDPSHAARGMIRVLCLPNDGSNARFLTLARKYLSTSAPPQPPSVIIEGCY